MAVVERSNCFAICRIVIFMVSSLRYETLGFTGFLRLLGNLSHNLRVHLLLKYKYYGDCRSPQFVKYYITLTGLLCALSSPKQHETAVFPWRLDQEPDKHVMRSDDISAHAEIFICWMD